MWLANKGLVRTVGTRGSLSIRARYECSVVFRASYFRSRASPPPHNPGVSALPRSSNYFAIVIPSGTMLVYETCTPVAAVCPCAVTCGGTPWRISGATARGSEADVLLNTCFGRASRHLFLCRISLSWLRENFLDIFVANLTRYIHDADLGDMRQMCYGSPGKPDDRYET